MTTAEEFLRVISLLNKAEYPELTFFIDQAADRMKEFARMHVQEALKAASEKVRIDMKEGMDYYYEDYIEGVNKESILNAYPTENIK